MWFGILTLLTALGIAGVAAWFSIAGLMAIFSAAALPIAVMAGTLEVGKLLTASWLYRYWHDTSVALRAYLSTAVVVLMLITSMGIFGYLSKAHLDQAGVSGDAIAIVDRIDGQIAREENRISIIEDRIESLNSSTGLDVQDSIDAQIQIRDTAWEQVQGDIDYNQEQINAVRAQLTTDIASLDNRLDALDKSVNDLRAKGKEVITTDEGGAFRRAETETIDYVAQADELRNSQQDERDQISDERASLREQANADIKIFQDAIDKYREQAQTTINNANAEVNRLRNQSTQSQDSVLDQIDTFNEEIDSIYLEIATLKDEKFEAEQEVRTLEKEVGPIKYVAQLLFGGDDAELLDKAVQVFILMLVFVFDPLAVMLVIAANQTLLRYGINIEKAGPKNGNTKGGSSTDELSGANASGVEGTASDREEPASSQSEPQSDRDEDLSVRSTRENSEGGDSSSNSLPSSVDDAALAMAEAAANRAKEKAAEQKKEIASLKRELKKKPKKEVIVKEKEVDLDLEPPKSVKDLEKKLSKRLNKDGN